VSRLDSSNSLDSEFSSWFEKFRHYRPLQKLTTVYPISKESFLVYSLDDLHNSSIVEKVDENNKNGLPRIGE
jgi:hypothetical protein